MKIASALLKGGKIYIQGYAQTTSGVWIATGPVYVSGLSQVDEAASLIRASLEHSVQGVPHPSREDWKKVQRPMLDALGAKNWAALAKGAKAVGIECEHGIVKLSPSFDYGNEGGEDRPDQAITVLLDADALGTKLVEAFDLSS